MRSTVAPGVRLLGQKRVHRYIQSFEPAQGDAVLSADTVASWGAAAILSCESDTELALSDKPSAVRNFGMKTIVRLPIFIYVFTYQRWPIAGLRINPLSTANVSG